MNGPIDRAPGSGRERSARVIPIASLDDERVAPYRNLKDRELAAMPGDLFIAEGELVVRRLLASRYPAESVLLAERVVEKMLPAIPAHVPAYAAPADVVNRIVGYRFHTGVMAVGRRVGTPSVDEVAGTWAAEQAVTAVVLPETATADNLGSMVRIASAFGAGVVLLGERCCDPFYRQAVRVSMGNVFRVPLVRSRDVAADLRRLREAHGVELAAAVCDDDDEAGPGAEPLASVVRRPRRLALLLGNEAQGLSAGHVALCQRRLTIPMGLGTDSLNVSVAAGILLYHLTQYARVEDRGG